MSAELAVLTKIKNNSDMYCIDNSLFDDTKMLDVSGIFPNTDLSIRKIVLDLPTECGITTPDLFNDTTNQWAWQFQCEQVTDAFNDVEMTYTDDEVISAPVYTTLNYNNNVYPAVAVTTLSYYATNVIYRTTEDYQKPFTVSFIFETENIVYGDNPYQGHLHTGTSILGNSNLMNFYFHTDNGGSMKFALYNSTNNFSYTNGTTGVTFETNKTYHVAVTVTTTEMKLYIDGIERATGTTTSQTMYQVGAKLYLGALNGENGKVANVRIIKRAVSDSEVLELAQELVSYRQA